MLLVDCGNTRIKWVRYSGTKRGPTGSAALDDVDAAMQALARSLAPGVERVLVANVAGADVANAIASTVSRQIGVTAEFVTVEANAYGVICGYRDPAKLGVDRWLAMLAVRRLVTGAYAVIGAGTAVTLDAVDAAGRHLGGLILPSDRPMLTALARQTRQIGQVSPATARPEDRAVLGRSTQEAVAHGACLAVAAALDRGLGIAADIAGELGTVLITGGNAEAVEPWLESDVQVRADLVLEGLAVVAGGKDSA